MSDAITYTQWWDTGGAHGYEARREGQATPVGYGDNQHEALEALLRSEHRNGAA